MRDRNGKGVGAGLGCGEAAGGQRGRIERVGVSVRQRMPRTADRRRSAAGVSAPRAKTRRFIDIRFMKRSLCECCSSVIVIPRTVLDLGRNPDGLVHLLQFLFLGDLVALGQVCILGLGRAGVVAQYSGSAPTRPCAAPPCTSSTLRARIVDPVPGLIDDAARIACIFVGRHFVLRCLRQDQKGRLRVEPAP